MVRRAAPTAMLLLLLAPTAALAVHGGPAVPLAFVSAADLKRRLDRGDHPTLVDLRPADAFRQGHVPGARSIPLRELRRRYFEIPRGRVILYCDCPRDELEAAYRLLVDRGAADVRGLEESFAAWAGRGYPVAR
jgi:rhodanese-related sulfurtransferase